MQKAYHWRIFTPANNQTIWPLQWWIIAPAFSDLTNVSHRPESGKTEIVYTTKFSKQHDPQSVIGALRQNEAITDLNLVPLSDMVNY